MSTASDDTRVMVLPIQPAPEAEADAESQYRLDAYYKVERFFKGDTKTHRNDYLNEIVAAIDKRIGSPGIAPDEKAEFESYVGKMHKLGGYKLTTDRQVSNAYSKLGAKSDRHSNAFFAMALNMLEAENQYHEERRSSTSALQKCIVDASNSLVGEKDADVITEMAGAVRNELTRDEKDAERSRAKHKALVDGMLSSFFKNCSHKGKGGLERYHKAMKAFLPRVMSIGDYNAMEHTAYPHDSLGWLRLAHLYDTERIWVCYALNFDFHEQSYRLENDERAWEQIHALKRRHLRKAPPYIKECLSLDESDESDEADELDEPMALVEHAVTDGELTSQHALLEDVKAMPDEPGVSGKRSNPDDPTDPVVADEASDLTDSDDEQWLAYRKKRPRPADAA